MVEPLKVVGTQLVSRNTGSVVKVQGVSTHGLQWYPQFVTKPVFQELRDNWRVNVVRAAMYTEEGGYCQDGHQSGASYATLLKAIGTAIELDIYVIVDWHVSNADQTPMKHLTEACDFFRSIGAKYQNDPHILYEICNEPNNAGNDYATQVAPYADKVIPIIRSYAPDAVVIIGSGMWSQQPYEAWQYDQRKGGRQNVMYTLHRYCEDNQNPSIGFEKWSPGIWTAVTAGCPIFATECGVSNPEETDWNCAAEFEKIAGFYDFMFIPWTVWSACDKGEPSSIFQSGGLTATPAGEVVKGALLKYAAPKSSQSQSGAQSSGNISQGQTSTPSPQPTQPLPPSFPVNNPTPPAPVISNPYVGNHMGIGIQLDPNGVSFTLSVLDANNQALASASFATPADLKAFADYLESQAANATQATAPKASLLSLASDIAPGDQVPTPRTDALEKHVKALADSHNKVLGTLGLLDGVLGGGGPFAHPPWGGGGWGGGWGGGQPYPYPQQPYPYPYPGYGYPPQPAPQVIPVPVPVQQTVPVPVPQQIPVYQQVPVPAPVLVERPVWRGGPIWGR